MPKKPAQPTLDESDKLWRELAGGPEPLPTAFLRVMRERYGPDLEYRVFQVVDDYETAGRWSDVVELVHGVLPFVPEDGGFLYPYLVRALVELGRLDEAEAAMPQLVAWLDTEDASGVLAAVLYYNARGDRENAALLFHAGSKWVSGFKTASKRLFAAKDIKRFGAAPANLGERLLAWFDRWNGMMTADVTKVVSFETWRQWLATVKPVKLTAGRADEITAEESRREALIVALGKAKNEASAQKLVDEIAWFFVPNHTGYPQLAPVFERAPLATFALMKHAIANQKYSRYGPSGQHGLMLSIALRQPSLAGELAAVYERAIGIGTANREHHLDFARAALRLGKRDAALRHIERALHYSARYWGAEKAPKAARKIHELDDFATLRGDPAYEQLFVVEPVVIRPKRRGR